MTDNEITRLKKPALLGKTLTNRLLSACFSLILNLDREKRKKGLA